MTTYQAAAEPAPVEAGAPVTPELSRLADAGTVRRSVDAWREQLRRELQAGEGDR